MSEISKTIVEFKRQEYDEHKFVVAFDVDGTLINYHGKAKPKSLRLLHAFLDLGATIVVWSATGIKYAAAMIEELDIKEHPNVFVAKKGSFVPDLAIDDGSIILGKVNLQLPVEDGEEDEEEKALDTLDIYRD